MLCSRPVQDFLPDGVSGYADAQIRAETSAAFWPVSVSAQKGHRIQPAGGSFWQTH